MKLVIFLSLALASLSAFAEQSMRLPLATGREAQFSGESTLVSAEAPQAVAETTTFGHTTLVDLYERTATGLQHSQFLFENGKLVPVAEQRISPVETIGSFIGKPLSPEGERQLGLVSLFRDHENPEDRDARLAPWLDLKNGGIAVGFQDTQIKKDPSGKEEKVYGSLLNGSEVPERSAGLTRLRWSDGTYGTGMMISLLEHAAEENARQHPEREIYVGAVAKLGGGYFPPHKSHQNGLDADITYLGTDSFNSQLDKDGKVLPTFETEQNWDFFRLLMSQRMVDERKEMPAVSMILVDQRIKDHFCQWTKATGHRDLMDLEILRRLLPTEGHDDHFHVRLHCSPYYPLCIRRNYDPRETGCKE